MAKSKYTVEEKKNFVRTYRKITKSFTKLNAEAIAEWCNQYYGLTDKLQGYDFRRPKEIRDWIDQINRRIMFEPEDGDGENEDEGVGIIHVVTESLIDIEFAVRNSSNTRALRTELQQANKRFIEIYKNNRKLATALRKTQEQKMNLETEADVLRKDHEKMKNTLKKKQKEMRKRIKEEEEKANEARRISAKLMEYIEKYIYAPVIEDHLVNDLGILTPEDGSEIRISEQLRSLFHDGCSDAESMMRFARWMPETEPEISEYEEFGNEDDEDIADPVVYTQAETMGLQLLEELEEG